MFPSRSWAMSLIENNHIYKARWELDEVFTAKGERSGDLATSISDQPPKS